MTNMTPSEKLVEMTDGQINKAVDVYRNILQKHRSELGSETVQQVLGQSDYVEEMITVLRKRVEVVSNLIVRHVKVDRSRTPQQVLDATKRKQYGNSDVVVSMSKGEEDEVDVYFFKLGRYVSDDDLEKEYELRGLKPADPYSQSAVNEVDPAFADEHPNGTHWKDIKSNWCFTAFHRWEGERGVVVSRHGHPWSNIWWFAGLYK